MKYSAQYNLTEEVKKEVLEAAQGMCASDSYYPRQIDNGIPRYGCALHGLIPKNWEELENLCSGGKELCHGTQLSHKKWLRWKTCGGNKEGIIISGNVVIYIREGRRHGIPNFFRGVFENKTPKWGTISYSSQRLDVSPFEMGV